MIGMPQLIKRSDDPIDLYIKAGKKNEGGVLNNLRDGLP